MKIKVLTYETKMNKKQEAYFLLKCEDKHSYNLPGKLGTPVMNAEYEIEYDEAEYEFQGKKVKSKWVKTFKPFGNMSMETKAAEIFGGKVIKTDRVDSYMTILVDPKTWEDAVYLTGCFVTGKDGDLKKMCDMTKQIYNELLKIRGSL